MNDYEKQDIFEEGVRAGEERAKREMAHEIRKAAEAKRKHDEKITDIGALIYAILIYGTFLILIGWVIIDKLGGN